MAITYQKAVNVKGTSSTGKAGDNIESEHYNKLARAFNDRLLYGVGDTTWRLFFSAHSMMRSMVRMKPGFNSENVWQEPTQEDAWWKIYSHIIPSPLLYESPLSKDYRSDDVPFSHSDSSSMSGTVYSWPTGKIGKFQGPETKNPLVAYVYGTAGGTVDWFYNSEKLPPEWFRAQLVKLELDLSSGTDLDLKYGARKWKDKALSQDNLVSTDEPIPLVDSFLWYDSKTNPLNVRIYSRSSSPHTLAQMWLMAKVQRGVVVPNINDPDVSLYQYKSSMTHAAAPAYMTARWYYDYYIHHRSPYGKTPPAYEPSPNIIGLCPWRDRRFPPVPRYEYIFSPVNPDTHKTLKFKTGCSGGTWASLSGLVYAVRREYDHYLIIFWDGRYQDPITKKRQNGNLRLSYKYYFEGPYDGGGRLTKRESEKDLMDSALNFYNSSFRKHFTASMSKEIFSKYLVETERAQIGAQENARYDNLSEATFDVPTWGFEFQDFFEKQYSLAPAIGKVNWKDSWGREDGEAEHLYEPEYPTFAFLANTSDGTHNVELAGGTEFEVYKSISRPDIDTADTFDALDSYGTEHFGLFTNKIITQDTKFYPQKKAGNYKAVSGGSRGDSLNWKNYCIAGYYIVGAGIRVTIDENGNQNPENVTFNLKEYKNADDNTVITTHEVSAGVNIVPDSGFCAELDVDGDTTLKTAYTTRETCTGASFTWIAEGVFEKMHYFAKGKDVALANRRVKLSSKFEYVFLDNPTENGGLWTRNGSQKAGNSWCGVAMEMAVLLRMRPDLPDAMLVLRLASTGFGSAKETVDLGERVGGEGDGFRVDSSVGFRPDTKGDMLPTSFNPDGTPDITLAPQKIWRNYDNYGIIKNLFNRNNLPHKVTKGHQRTDSESYTKRSMDENIAAGGEAGEVGNSELPINFNPIYNSAREMYHRHLRMVPRTRLEDYEVIRDHSDAKCISQDDKGGYKIVDEHDTEQACMEPRHEKPNNSWVGVKEKSELTFRRYVDMYQDPDIPDMGGAQEETLHEKVYNPIVVEPEKPGGPSEREPNP